jgi:hypothetical protein
LLPPNSPDDAGASCVDDPNPKDDLPGASGTFFSVVAGVVNNDDPLKDPTLLAGVAGVSLTLATRKIKQKC